MDADHRVVIFLYKCPHKVVGTLLHLWVGTLNSVQLDAVGVSSGIHGGDGATPKADAIVVATDHYDFVSLLWLLL